MTVIDAYGFILMNDIEIKLYCCIVGTCTCNSLILTPKLFIIHFQLKLALHVQRICYRNKFYGTIVSECDGRP